MYFPILRIVGGPFALTVVSLVTLCGQTLCGQALCGQEPSPPRPLQLSDSPSKHSLLVYPEENTMASPPIQENAATGARRYQSPPRPEDLPGTAPVRTGAVQPSDQGRIIQAAERRVRSEQTQQNEDPELIMPAEPDMKNLDPSHPPVQTASFLGVIPGETTIMEVDRYWGKPVQEEGTREQGSHLYSTEALNHIEVFYKNEIVRSIIVRLDEPFPEEQVREVLQSELLESKPVLIPDETGQIIGEVFPEKGVLFLFAPSENPSVYLVRQIGIEPVESEPFVLRAEATLTHQPRESRRDLRDAIQLNPRDAKAFWLLSRIELMEGQIESALLHAEKAIQLDERRPAYHLHLAQALMKLNLIEEAKLYLEETLGICDRYPHEKARALCMLGDLYRNCQNPDYEMAIDYHSDAIRVASALVDHANPTIRQTAKDVLFDAHLGAARDVAWGQWEDKEEAIERWIDQAMDIAEDPEMISAKRYSAEYPFKLAVCTLACQVGFHESTNIEPQIREVIHTGELLIQSTNDPILLRKYQWETSLSLYDAVQIYQLRKRYTQALKYGEIAADYMEAGVQGRRSETDRYLLGRLYFRLGAIHAIGNKNHRAAIEWYDRAKPVFERLIPKINPDEFGRLGETLVSMGVSYWMTGQREEAVRLTERGLKQIDRGVKLGLLEPAVFSIPYANLENMYRELGMPEQSRKFAQLSATIK